MRVSLLEPLNVDKSLIDDFTKELKDLGHEFTYYQEKTTDIGELVKRSEGQDIVMIANNPYPAQVIEAVDGLKLINVAFTGVDHVGTDAAKARGVDVCNASGYSDQAVAELVLGLNIGLYRQMKKSDKEVRQGGLPRIGREISGKKVAIVGTGNIGLATAKLYKAFGADLLGYDLEEKQAFKDLGGTYLGIDDLLKEADIVSLHLPVTQETTRFIDEAKLSLMKEDAVLINCARGKIVDNEALAKDLNEDRLGGAGVDVYDMEPPIPEDYCLLGAKNTILSPHIAYLTQESMVRRAAIAFDNTLAYLKGEKKNLVNL